MYIYIYIYTYISLSLSIYIYWFINVVIIELCDAARRGAASACDCARRAADVKLVADSLLNYSSLRCKTRSL